MASAAGSVRPWDPSKNTWSMSPDSGGSDAANIDGRITWWDGVWTALMYTTIFAFVLIVVRISYLVIRADHTPRERKTELPEKQPVERLAEAVETGLAQIDRGTPNNAVIACWVALEDAAAAAGVARDVSETAAEFTVRVLAVDGVSTDDLLTLADLYREARYSNHASTEETRTQARAVLTNLRAQLEAAGSSWSWRPWR